MKTPIEVRLMGPSLLCQAVEALLATVGPIYSDSNPVAEGTEGSEDASGVPPMRRRLSASGSVTTVILLVGEGWQNRVNAESRMPRRAGVSATGMPTRYALIVEGSKIDFYGARKMAVNAFIGTDEPISVLIQGIQATASNRLYCSPQLLPALIEAVGSGGTISDGKPNSASGIAHGEDDTTASQAALLSSREHEVALHAARGLSNEQIAVFLGISIPTVKFHLMHAFRKLDIQRRTQLYAYMPYLTSATEALLPK